MTTITVNRQDRYDPATSTRSFPLLKTFTFGATYRRTTRSRRSLALCLAGFPYLHTLRTASTMGVFKVLGFIPAVETLNLAASGWRNSGGVLHAPKWHVLEANGVHKSFAAFLSSLEAAKLDTTTVSLARGSERAPPKRVVSSPPSVLRKCRGLFVA